MLDMDWIYIKTNQTQINKLIEIFMNKKNKNNIKPGEANFDENSLQHFTKHFECIYETEKEQHKIQRN
jgi:hypothetical protein